MYVVLYLLNDYWSSGEVLGFIRHIGGSYNNNQKSIQQYQIVEAKNIKILMFQILMAEKAKFRELFEKHYEFQTEFVYQFVEFGTLNELKYLNDYCVQYKISNYFPQLKGCSIQQVWNI